MKRLPVLPRWRYGIEGGETFFQLPREIEQALKRGRGLASVSQGYYTLDLRAGRLILWKRESRQFRVGHRPGIYYRQLRSGGKG